MTLQVLVVEDERDMATMVAYGARMTWPECQVAVATDGAEALRLFAEQPPDVVVLDVEIPPPDGLTVLQRIRASSQVPVLMLTVRGETLDKVRALDLGADDYLTKPYDPLELLARLRALLRRSQGAATPSSALLVVGEVTLDPATHEARVRGEVVRLTSTEARLLEELMRHAGHVIPYRQLLQAVWGPEYGHELEYLRTFVRRLRRKLGDDPSRPRYIQTEWHRGYRFASPL